MKSIAYLFLVAGCAQAIHLHQSEPVQIDKHNMKRFRIDPPLTNEEKQNIDDMLRSDAVQPYDSAVTRNANGDIIYKYHLSAIAGDDKWLEKFTRGPPKRINDLENEKGHFSADSEIRKS